MRRIVLITMFLWGFSLCAVEEPLELKAGWNLVSVPTAFKGVTSKVLFAEQVTDTVWYWNPTLQEYRSAGDEPLSDRVGYWVYVPSDKSIVFPTSYLKVIAPVEDVSVTEKQTTLQVDLSKVFTDETGSFAGIVKTLVSNSHNAVVSAVVTGDQLTLTFPGVEPGVAGYSDLTIRAVKGELEILETVRVSVTPVDDPPVVTRSLANVVVDEDASNTVVSLVGLIVDADSTVVYSAPINSNNSLLTATVVGENLVLSYGAEQSGNARITLRATSGGKVAETSFDVRVNVVDDAPVVARQVGVTQIDAGALLDFSDTFDDVDSLNSAIVLSVTGNSNSGLVLTSWQGKVLSLTLADGASMTNKVSSNITVQADSAGKQVSYSFPITITPFPTAKYVVIDVSGGSAVTSFPVTYLSALPVLLPDEYKTTKIVLRQITKGVFTMGSPVNEVGRSFTKDELQHQVTLSQNYYIGVTEVTQKQYELVTNQFPSGFAALTEFGTVDSASTKDDMLPVESVSWQTIRGAMYPGGAPKDTSFLGILRSKSGLSFDLPTEAQWEYACRAGTLTGLNSGLDLASATAKDTRPYDIELLAWYRNNADSSVWKSPHARRTGTQDVALLNANAWGLYDMHGNVYEWCLDWYVEYDDVSYGGGVNPQGGLGTDISEKVYRGGGWSSFPWGCRSANRAFTSPSSEWSFLGFRLALTPTKFRSL